MSLKLTLYKKDQSCTTIISVEISHFSNFKNKNVYHILSKEQLIRLVSALVTNDIPFNFESQEISIDESKVRIRLD